MAFKKSKMPSEIRKMLYFLCGMYMFDAAAWQKVAASVEKISGGYLTIPGMNIP